MSKYSTDFLIPAVTNPNTTYVKKNYTDYFHLYYKNEDFFSIRFIKDIRDDSVEFWDNYQHWEHSTTLLNLTPNTYIIEEGSPYDLFDGLHRSSFTSFFSTNLIDIPRCFKHVKSLYRQSHLVPILKFTNLVMRHGFKEKVFKTLSSSANLYITSFFKDQFLNKVGHFNWFTLFRTFYTFHVGMNTQTTYGNNLTEFPLFNLHSADFNFRYDSDLVTFKEMFFSNLSEIEPVFNFYVYKVNKSKRKNSRGKTGKYTLLWKYITPFKRLYLTFRWLLRDIKFQKAKNFETRFYKFWQILHTNLFGSLAYQVKTFSHKFIFQNYRRTLMSSLRASL